MPNILTVAVKWPDGMKPLPLATETATNFTLGKATVKDGCAHIDLTAQEAKALEDGYYLHFDADGRFLTLHAEPQREPITPTDLVYPKPPWYLFWRIWR